MIATPAEPDLPVPVPESFHEQTNEELTETDIKRMDADDQAIQTILLGLPEDVYAAVDSCKTAKEIWEHVRQMMKGSDIGEQEKKAKLFNEWEKFMSTDGESIESIQGTQNAGVQSVGNQNGLVVVPGIANQSGTGNVVVARAEGTGIRNQARCYNCRGLGIQLQAEEFNFMAAAGDLDEIKEVNANCILMANLQQASTSSTQHDRAPVYDTDGSAETMHMLNPKPDSFYHPNQKMALGYPNPSYLKKAQLKQQSLYNGNLLLEEHDPPAVYDSEETLEVAQESREKIRLLKKEIKPANYAKIIHLSRVFVPQTTKSKEELFLLNVSNMATASKTISIPNEDLSNDTTPSVARKFVNEVKSSLVTLQHVVKQKMTLEVHNCLVDVLSDLQIDLDRTKEKLELCIIKKEKEYAILWNNWYTKCEECKYDKISYDKAYNDMQQKIKRLQAQLRDLKELEFQVVNYEREISHLKTTYKNLLEYIKSNQPHAKLHDLIFENAKLRARLFKNTSESLKNTSGTSVTPYVDKPKLSTVTPDSKKLHASTQSHSVPQPNEFNVVRRRNVIAPGMFKINPSQTPRVDLVPNKQSCASIRINPITNSQRHVIVKENVSSNMATASSIGLVHNARTRMPQLKGNTRNAKVHYASKSSEVKKIVTVEDHRRTLLLSMNRKTMSSESNNIKLAIRNDKSKIVCDTFVVMASTIISPKLRHHQRLAKNDLVSGLPKFKYAKEHLCPSCEQGKSKRASHPPKPVSNSKQRLHLLHMDLCGPMRVASINGKWYVLVIVDDYSRYTWVYFLKTKDETPENDREDIGKLGAKGDIGFFIGYSANYVAYEVYNWRTRKIMKMMNVTFDELSAMAFEQNSSRPRLQSMTSGQISSKLELTYAPSTIAPQRLSEHDLDILFEPLYNEFLGDSAPVQTNSSNTPVSSHNANAISQQHAQQQRNLTPSPTVSATDNVPNARFEGELFVNPFVTPSTESVVSSTQYVDPSNMHTFYQPYPHDYQWTKDHPLEQVIGEPSRPVLTRNQLKTDGDMCIYALTVSILELKTVKKSLNDPSWIESMQEQLH
nr:integrase, catalytic region, zinc finger, CCHC-type, peptidase aspartic, catalytic [Tanacetum cinerariifolium]